MERWDPVHDLLCNSSGIDEWEKHELNRKKFNRADRLWGWFRAELVKSEMISVNWCRSHFWNIHSAHKWLEIRAIPWRNLQQEHSPHICLTLGLHKSGVSFYSAFCLIPWDVIYKHSAPLMASPHLYFNLTGTSAPCLVTKLLLKLLIGFSPFKLCSLGTPRQTSRYAAARLSCSNMLGRHL